LNNSRLFFNMKKINLLLLSGLLAVGFSVPSHADIVVSDNFDTQDLGDLTGQDGGIGYSSVYQPTDTIFGDNVTPPTQTVVAGGLTYTNGAVTIAGGSQSVDVTTTNGSVEAALTRELSVSLTGQTYYERVVLDPSALPNFFIYGPGTQESLNNAGTGVFSGSTAATLGNYFNNTAFNFQNAGATTSANLTVGAANLLVAEFVWNGSEYKTVNLFLNPSSLTEGTPDATFSIPGNSDGAQNLGSLTSLALANTDATYQIDSFAIGTSYADVVTGAVVPEPASYALTILGGLGLLGLHLRRKASAKS
jgi:PEP-CTERM motif